MTPPEEESDGIDAKRSRHPGRGQSGPQWMIFSGQVEKGGQVGGNVRQAKYHVEEDKLAKRYHPAKLSNIPCHLSLLTSRIVKVSFGCV